LNALDRVRDVDFPLVLRGYDRQAVDDYVAEIAQLVAELEATQLRESVVQRALDEVGEETSGILRRAHETAEEIAARSRAQAEGRIQRAEREAEIVRREADEYAEQVVVDTKRLWEERQRLVEEIRQLADEVLATADDALERVKEPELLRREREAAERKAQAKAPEPTLSVVENGPAEPGAPFDGEEAGHPLDAALEDEAVVARDPVSPGDEEIAAAEEDVEIEDAPESGVIEDARESGVIEDAPESAEGEELEASAEDDDEDDDDPPTAEFKPPFRPE
jgi:DivIVA domain-containing protein